MSGLFGPAHLTWLLIIAVAAVSLADLCRRQRLPQRPLRATLACLLVACEIQRYIQDGLAWPDRLPVQVCSVTAWVAVAACITLSPAAIEYVYFVGLAGAGMAVITPDMGAQWPVRFFITHGVLIVTACVLTFGDLVPRRRGAIWRAYGLMLIAALLMGLFDWATHMNYWYLRGKPESFTVYNWLGPWPVYLGSVALFSLALFGLLWLPWRFGGGRPLAVRSPHYSPRSTSSGLRRTSP